MKKHIVTILLLFFCILSYSQEEESLEVFTTDSTWIKEIIKFPINFAQDINYEGFEDLRFPQGWSNQESPNFWSYVWAWNINGIEKPSESDLEKNVQLYFDGLLGLDFYKINDVKTPKTNAVFIKKGNTQYVGKVKTIDTRYTKLPMTLNVLVEYYYCEIQKKTIMVFRYSPKPFDNAVWYKLNEVKLRADACEF
ncbi:hypothetical protein MWU58_12750 [Flavobacteriaceae bacterium S0825]|uniref:hypothetical protein n=1 Tax=Gaetbulibacter sp. S0825 TaxID=2720084 RepID=UPI00142FD905|nr:hypothetical protein [Gaetbulibacter sp. S0825]MCK0110169.1 hypothetical protein [Flavobacteriaceae bacterium S0825]NIX65798.1 hypothetical protein [Gaetbulibacter sp. S0825]